jgi:16S rRNA (cytidine1402-2'-O)-methyltransferase
MHGTLYLIPNLLASPDSFSAELLVSTVPAGVQSIASQLDYFIAENAKTARSFLKVVHELAPLRLPLQQIRIAELNVKTEASALPALLQAVEDGNDAGLISEAGVPAIADPGAELVRLAHRRGIPVKPLVGPSSILLAAMASGLNGQSFAFNGYLPIDAQQRASRIKALEQRSRQEKQTQLFIETPYRNGALLEALTAACQPHTLLTIATDLSLPTERIRTQRVEQWRTELAANEQPDFHKKPTVFAFLGA